MSIEARLKSLGVQLPAAATPVANYVPTVEAGGLLYISGQISRTPSGGVMAGRLGDSLDVAAGREAARTCALSILAQAKSALGSLERIDRIVKLTAFVNATAAFTEHPQVVNGASDLLVEILGDAGRHTRSAVGVASLPLDAAVEIEAIIATRKA